MFKFVVLCALVASAVAFVPRQHRLDGRIVGGQDTVITSYPHQVSLQSYGSHICGASIISPIFVVTAAHCTDGATASRLTIRAGITDLNEDGELLKVTVIHQHPQYNGYTIDYDISVLQLLSSITIGLTASPAWLVQDGFDPAVNSDVICTGWGATKEGGWGASVLQEVHIQITSREECKDQYGSDSITERMICAGVPQGGKDACQGDSGGPLIGDGKLVGIVSWGNGCGRPGYSGVYSNVGALRSFIREKAGV